MDLDASEFVLFDSGVRQDVAAVGAGAVPLDVTLVVQRTAWIGAELLNAFTREIRDVARTLRDADRLRVVSAEDDVPEIVPWSAADEIGDIPPTGMNCVPVHDALATVLIQPGQPARQQIAVVMSVTPSRGDVIDAGSLMNLARRSSVRVFVVRTGFDMAVAATRRPGSLGFHRPQCVRAYANWHPERRNRLRDIDAMRDSLDGYRALHSDEQERLVAVAEATGGGGIRPGAFTRSIAGPVRNIVEDARSGYILYYQPAGVPERGWHPIEVRVTRPGRYEVRARPGYAR